MIDWTDAFDNSSYVPGSDKLAGLWSDAASAYRDRAMPAGRARLDIPYGPGPRNRFDLFLPGTEPKGLIVFIHGGYWKALDRSFWSHMAAGPLSHGWAMAIPSYTLAPEARISEITREIGAAITAAAGEVPGPIRIIGHSAGGHLVSRMLCRSGPLDSPVLDRLERAISVSGIHDLRPLLQTDMNKTLRLSEAEAEAESPALQDPHGTIPIYFWVGAAERPELVRQTRLIGEIWGAKGADTSEVYEPGQDHFSVISALADAESPLVNTLTAPKKVTP
ncbi:alpha/beta hydrolase [Rhodophyticola porphyridii]|uniref:alpha/beta hydrolase n=1 Tax=Rhodophyticola porphyridii TaxID=1852017 RepID=UPI0035D01E84